MQILFIKVWHRLRRAIKNEAMEKFLIISIGAMLGANARYWVGGWAAEKLGAGFPYGTLIVNLTGSFLTVAEDR